MRRMALALLTFVTAGLSLSLIAAAESVIQRRAVVAGAVAGSPLPADMLSPEGRTRWDLTSFPRGELRTETLQGVTGDQQRWLLPNLAPEALRPGHRESFEIAGDKGPALRADTEIVGIGWAHLPAGPREVVLQRALVFDPASPRGAGWKLMHRWIDPRAGVVAWVGGPADADGRRRLGVDEAGVVDDVQLGAADLKIYVDELDRPIYDSIAYGRDKGDGTLTSSLTPEAYATVGALIAASTWNFSGNTTGAEVASTSTPINAAETCNWNKCGYNVPGVDLDREDKNFGDPNTLFKTNTATQRETRPTDVTLWARAGTQNEGRAGSLGTGESGFCYVTDGTGTRNPVPLFRFSNNDAGGWYMQVGDPTWSGGPGASCQQTLFNEVCSGGGLFSKLYAKSCPGHTGTQYGQVVKAGVVTLPSGHTFNALLIRIVADFCVYGGATCGFVFDQVRTVNYLWQVPHMGTVVRLQSEQNVPDDTSWGIMDATDIKFGLFPPRTITVTGNTDTTVSISWDPGLDTHRINDYKVYWDTDSGGATPYAFNSVTHPGQVAFAGTTATISGLTSGATYHITVTARSIFTDPSSSIVTTYESLLYPSQVSGDPSFVYPIEVMATTTPAACQPTVEVGDLMVTTAGGGNIEICWDTVVDPCAQGYRVIGSDTASSSAGFATVADTVGAVTCWTGNPDDTYFLVLGRSATGTGPWGHYGQ
ncbi:MAG: fibronectin type III domain-containing protein [Candidatus Polarisedimenticolia bacterium]